MTDAALTPADALAQLAFLVHGMLDDEAAAHDLSIVQLRMLGLLRDRTPLMSELGARLGLDKSSISGLVQRAEKRGLVERFPSPDDGRAVLVRLTADGRRLAAAGEADFDADVTRMLAPLPERDRAALTALISRLLVAHGRESGVEIA